MSSLAVNGDYRRPLNTACKPCKRRKVRCDIGDAGPCTPCSKSGAECLRANDPPRPQKRRRQAEAGRNKTSRTSPQSPQEARNSTEGRIRPPMPSPQATRDETLTKFFERGIGASTWQVFHEADPIRIVYVGDQTSNLHHLVQTEDLDNRLHFPFPPIKPQLPWKPEAQDASQGAYLTAAIAQDLASFPSRPVRDALVQKYFDDIHPGFPIIDEEEFRRQYQDPANPPPLLIFHAVLLAAARISDHPMVAPARATVTATLFRRAKTLFEMHYENDRSFLVQAALLMAWHVEDADTISSNAYHWIGSAVRIALGLGMHRDLTAVSRTLMPNFDRRTYRKLWWLVLQSESLAALEYGRPPMIRAEDYDQPPLSEADFLNINGSSDELVCKDYVLMSSELCETALEVLALNAPRATHHDIASLDSRLVRIAMQLPRTHDFWSCNLRIYHGLVTLVMHRTRRTPDSSAIAREAASTILTTYETILAAGTIRKCSFHCSTALLAAAIHFAQDVKSALASKSFMRANAAHAQLERLLRPASALSMYWPHVEALSKLCVSLCGRCSSMIRDSVTQPVEQHLQDDFLGNADLPWQDIMAGYQLPDLRLGFDTEDWMNTF